MRLVILSVVTILVIAITDSVHSLNSQDSDITTFEQFKSKFNKQYESLHEEVTRRNNFYRSLKWIQENQDRFGSKLAINELSDLSNNEFSPMNLTSHQVEYYAGSIPTTHFTVDHNLPAHFDWREHLQFNPIEHQHSCGACWAFAATAAVEASYMIKHKVHVHLSKQELVDCSLDTYDHEYRNHGCHGGYPTDAFKYVMKHGLLEEVAYPYKALPNETCYTSKMNNPTQKRYHVNQYHRLTYRVPDEEMMTVIKQYGPVAINLYAHHDAFKHYKSGIMRNLFPDIAKITHAIALIGWGTEGGVDYWIVRNSWGVSWGEQGYGKIERHHNFMGINNFPSVPVLN